MGKEAYLIIEKNSGDIIGDIIVQDKYGIYSYASTLLILCNPYVEGLQKKLDEIVDNNKFGIIKINLGSAEEGNKSYLEYKIDQFYVDRQNIINDSNIKNTIIINDFTYLEPKEGMSPKKFVNSLNKDDNEYNINYLQKESFDYFVDDSKENRKENKLLVYVDEDKEMHIISGTGAETSYVCYADNNILLDIKYNPIKDLNNINELYVLKVSDDVKYVIDFYRCDENRLKEFDFNSVEIKNYIESIKEEKAKLNEENKNVTL